MNFDADGHLVALVRSVSMTERDGRPAGAVTLSRGCGATVDDLWDAVTNRRRVPRWFLPVHGDLEPGGRYRLEGNASGMITACDRPSHFALTWEFGGDTSWVDVRLTDGGAAPPRITLTHTALLSPHWDEYGPGAAGVGWEMGLLGLALHLAQPDAPKPDEAAFAASPDGRAFITGSSEAWGRAAAEAGTAAAAAADAARRTAAFYLGESAGSG